MTWDARCERGTCRGSSGFLRTSAPPGPDVHPPDGSHLAIWRHRDNRQKVGQQGAGVDFSGADGDGRRDLEERWGGCLAVSTQHAVYPVRLARDSAQRSARLAMPSLAKAK